MLPQAQDEQFCYHWNFNVHFPSAQNNQSEFNKFPLGRKIICFITDINIFPLLK